MKKGKKGASIAKAASKQATEFTRAHSWRIIRARGASAKSAPLIPFERETAPRENERKMEIRSSVDAKLKEGLKTKKPTIPVTAKITKEKSSMKKYLLLIRLRGEIGDEKIRQAACPSSPIMKVPKLIAIRQAGNRKISAGRISPE